ncbi:hypothetical protein KR009_009317 [Drosophila setifemur]|nr:hypothetical protein KR009_009317 [Drosophila setifemur]
MSSNTCSTCGKQFGKPALLQRHQVVHTKQKLFACDSCSRSFSQLSSLQRHKRNSHHPNDSSQSASVLEDADQVAKQALSALRSLQSGMEVVTNSQAPAEAGKSTHQRTTIEEEQPPCQLVELRDTLYPTGQAKVLTLQRIQRSASRSYYVCEFCAKEFFKLYDIIRHRRSHTKEKPYPCRDCLKRFATQSKLNEHRKRLHRISQKRKIIRAPHDIPLSRSYKCLYCSKMYVRKFNCRRHMLTHSRFLNKENKELKSRLTIKSCSSCGKTFKKSNDLSRHLLTHSQTKSHTCNLCQKSFTLKSTLHRHMQIHLRQRPAVNCQVCGKSYSSRTALTLHLRLHTGERPFQCEICQQTFRTSGHRLEHMRAERHSFKPTSTLL